MITDQLLSAEVEARVVAIAHAELRRTNTPRFTVTAVCSTGEAMRVICDRTLMYTVEFDRPAMRSDRSLSVLSEAA